MAFLEKSTSAQPASEPSGVLIPFDSVAEDGDGQFVFVVDAERTNRRSVTLAERRGARVRIVAGLGDGERVVADLSGELLSVLLDGGKVSVVN